jgi:MFS family permease
MEQLSSIPSLVPEKKFDGVSILVLGFLGLLSGIATSYFVEVAHVDFQKAGDLAFYIPGFIFGFTLSIFFVFFGSFSLKRFTQGVLFIGVSMGAWYMAVVSYLSSLSSEFSLVFAGFVGGGILLVGIHLLFERLRTKYIIIGGLIAGVLGYSMLLSSFFEKYQLSSLFIIWQTGVACVIGWFLKKEQVANKQRDVESITKDRASNKKVTAAVVAVITFLVLFQFILPLIIYYTLGTFIQNSTFFQTGYTPLLLYGLLIFLISFLLALLVYKKIKK